MTRPLAVMNAAPIRLAPRLLPLRLPRLCVAIAGSDAVEMIEKAELAVRDNSFIEFRLDYLKTPASVYQKIHRFIEYHPTVIAIATCRRAVNGGRFRGSGTAQVEVLIKAANQGWQLVDLEMQSAESLKVTDIERIRSRAALVLSYHDYRGTKKLEEKFQKMLAHPADFFKIVTTATSLYDNVVMMKFLEKKSERHTVIGLCMGEQGVISRILGVRAGSMTTFAAANPGEETAPGQIAARTLHEVYRIEQVDAATRVYGVAGDPVAHSLSPLMMNAAFRRETVNAVYLALHAKTLPDLLACVRDIPIHGLSITMPYKQEILKYLDNSDPLTEKIGACNTVIRAQDGKIYGFNTDVAGIVGPVQRRMHIAGARVLVVGAGGAARAAVYGLRERGAEVYILNRTASEGQKLARRAHARFIRRAELKKIKFDVIINATPVGMGSSRETPLKEDELQAKYLFELVYTPAETKLAKLARARGIEVIPGREMFVYQGARQFEIWTGKPAPVDEMERVVFSALAEPAAAKNGASGRK